MKPVSKSSSEWEPRSPSGFRLCWRSVAWAEGSDILESIARHSTERSSAKQHYHVIFFKRKLDTDKAKILSDKLRHL